MTFDAGIFRVAFGDGAEMSDHIFISFNSTDRLVTDQVCETLEAEGRTCWICHRDIIAGKPYAESVASAIESAAACVVIVTTSSIQSSHVKREIELAAHHRLWIFPLMLGDVKLAADFQYFLSSLHFYKLSESPSIEEVLGFARAVRNALPLQKNSDDTIEPIQAASRRLHTQPRAILSAPARKRFGILLGCLLLAGIGYAIWRATDFADPLPVSSREILRLVYQKSPTGMVEKKVGLQVDVLSHRGGSPLQERLDDRMQLASNSDLYFMETETQTDGYMYVFQIDSAGQIDWLFPKNASKFSSGLNPVKRGVVRIPAVPEMLLSLNNVTGYEHIYAVLSASRWTDLESLLEKSIGVPSETSTLEQLPVAGTSSVVRSPLGLGVRGVGNMRTLDTGYQSVSQAKPSFVVESLDGIVVIERVFEHVSN